VHRFPEGFIWGSATSAYQIEGAWRAGGKGLSIWDAFAHTPERTQNGETGDVACDHYHRFREDVELMAAMGLPAYRFSVSWSRIQPTGCGRPNRDGLRFYSDLIDALLEHDIAPWVTLYHWDLPLSLQLEEDGWLNPRISERFTEYARICYSAFGDRVKHWITFNEPWVCAVLGHGHGVFAPGRRSRSEPYRVAHEMLRAHARAVELYRREFQPKQNGIIGITNNCDWREPLTDAAEDREAAERALEFFLGWFADPVYRGEYPESMRARLGGRLPVFSAEDRSLLVGSSDFFGLNHYTTMYASHVNGEPAQVNVFGNGGMAEDQCVNLTVDPAWPQTTMEWSVVPWGCRKLLEWIDGRYERPEIIITENGCAAEDRLVEGVVEDVTRIEYLNGYLRACLDAIENGVTLKGYFVWSFLDNFEWALGYSKRFGIHHIDFPTGTRTPKSSAHWFRQVIQQNGLPVPQPAEAAAGRE
jgi:beta-galactosidase